MPVRKHASGVERLSWLHGAMVVSLYRRVNGKVGWKRTNFRSTLGLHVSGAPRIRALQIIAEPESGISGNGEQKHPSSAEAQRVRRNQTLQERHSGLEYSVTTC